MITKLAPGDLCASDDQCYGNGTCASGKCRAVNTEVGSDCSADDYYLELHKNCPVGMYCSSDKKCEITPKVGDDCM